MTIADEIRNDPEKGARLLESEYKTGLFTLARRLCDDDGDAEELVNRTFAEVVRGIDSYLEQSAFFGWMCQILVNIRSKDVRRRSNRTVETTDGVDELPDEDAAVRLFRDVDASIVRDAVQSLPADMREAVVMRYFLDLPLRRMAKILCVPEGTVNSRLHYARLALAAKLGAATRRPGAKTVLLALLLAAGLAVARGVWQVVFDSHAESAEYFDSHAESAEDAETPNAAEGGFDRTQSALGTPVEPASNVADGDLEISNKATQSESMKPSSLLAATASLALAAAPASGADDHWTLSGTVGNVSMTDGEMTLYMTVENQTDRTLALGRSGNARGNAMPNGTNQTGSYDLSKPILDDGGNEWTIVRVMPWAFYASPYVTGTLDLSSVTNIGDAAFGYAKAFTSFVLSPRLEEVGASAFNSTFANRSFSPQLPASLKTIRNGAFGHHSQWDNNLDMELSGTVELRGIERIENGAFYQCKKIDTLVIGPGLVQLGGAGTRIDSMRTDAPPFEQMNALKSVQWLGGPPASGIPKALFWTGDGSANVTNYVYVDYLDAWTNAINASGMAVGSAVAGTDPAVWPIEPNDVWHRGKLWLSLLPGHPEVEGVPVFAEPPAVVKRNGTLVFRAILAEGTGTDVFAVFSDSTGVAWTNLVASGVDGDPETVLEASVPASLPADRTYSFAALATNAVGSAVRGGAGTFFHGAVSVTASAAFSEADGTGSFTFSRNGTDGDLVVPFSLGGTAAEFVNFRELPRSVTIPDGVSSAAVAVESVADLASDADVTLSLAVSGDGLFLVDPFAGSASVTIENWSPPAAGSFARQAVFSVRGYGAERGGLAEFPVLVRVPAGVVSDPDQLAFFGDGRVPLPFEIDTWDDEGESLVWVGVRQFRADARIVLCTGRSGYAAPDLAPALWRAAGYVVVLHCGEEGPDLAGSTVQGVGGEAITESGASAGVAKRVAGAAGAARLLSEWNAWTADCASIRVPNYERYLADPFRLTFSFWLNHRTDAETSDEALFGNRDVGNGESTGFSARLTAEESGSAPAFRMFGNGAHDSGAFEMRSEAAIDVSASQTNAVPWRGAWTHLSFSLQPGPDETTFYIAGERAVCSGNYRGGPTGSTSFATIQSRGADAPVYFGNAKSVESAARNGFKGSMDEIRVRDGAVTDDWAFAEYATVADPDFLSFLGVFGSGTLIIVK